MADNGNKATQVIEGYVKLSEACKVLDKSRMWVRRLVKEGRLESKRNEANHIFVSEVSIVAYKEYLAERGARGAARKDGTFKQEGRAYSYTPAPVRHLKAVRRYVKEAGLGEELSADVLAVIDDLLADRIAAWQKTLAAQKAAEEAGEKSPDEAGAVEITAEDVGDVTEVLVFDE